MKIKTSAAGITLVVLGLLAGYGCIAPGAPKAGAPANPPPPPAGPGEFVETFDSPAGFFDRFQTQVFHDIFPEEIMSWQGDHDEHCSAPTSTRTINGNDPSQFFYWCGPTGPASGHIMTTMNTAGYSELDFAPNVPITGIKKVCWDQNRTDLGERKWTQMVVVPEAVYQANGRRLDYQNPAEGEQERNIPITSDTFMFVQLGGSSQTYLGPGIYDANFAGDEPLISDKARRFRTCVADLENGTVRIELERQTGTEVRVQRGAFPNGAARVIFQDDSYDPPKDLPAVPVPNPFTWHWDNIAITT